ncbi:COG1835 Predicted acyltransferases [Candidatus Nanopelagicaceae bacterium]
MVLAVHLGQQFFSNSKYSSLNSLLDLGKHGVAFFFFLSGTLLAISLRQANYSVSNYKRFILKRLLRIYPAYLFSLIILSSAQNVSQSDFLQHLFLLHSLQSQTFGSINYPYWSLSVEFLAYLIFPFLIWIKSERIRKSLFVMIVTVGISWQVFGYVARTYLGFDSNYNLSATFYLMTALPAFVIGIYRNEVTKSSRLRRALTIFATFAVADSVIAAVGILYEVDVWYPVNQLMHGSFGYLAFGALALKLLDGLERKRYSPKSLKFISQISYSLYLWQLPIILFSINSFGRGIKSFTLSVLLLGVAGFLSYKILEEPFVRASRRTIELEGPLVK